ncbi:MAG: MarR family transcriptional regulator [Alphaproteobacteria bacterium]|nr:MarR family transcriptional regulator [Alphaproteobacteria bacterium]
MNKIRANHYTETLIYKLDGALKNIKLELNQFILTLEPHITSEQFAVLDTVYGNEGICQQDVANILMKDKSNIKRLVEILEEKQYVVRSVGRKNNRLVNYLTITVKGKEVVDANMPKVKQYLEKRFDNVSQDEMRILENIMAKIKKNA